MCHPSRPSVIASHSRGQHTSPFPQTSTLAPAHTPLLLGSNWLRGSLAHAHLLASPPPEPSSRTIYTYEGVAWSPAHLDGPVASQAPPPLSRERCSSPSHRYLHPHSCAHWQRPFVRSPLFLEGPTLLLLVPSSRTLVQGPERGLKIRARENCILSAAAPASPPAPYPRPLCRHRALRFFFLPPSPQAGRLWSTTSNYLARLGLCCPRLRQPFEHYHDIQPKPISMPSSEGFTSAVGSLTSTQTTTMYH